MLALCSPHLPPQYGLLIWGCAFPLGKGLLVKSPGPRFPGTLVPFETALHGNAGPCEPRCPSQREPALIIFLWRNVGHFSRAGGHLRVKTQAPASFLWFFAGGALWVWGFSLQGGLRPLWLRLLPTVVPACLGVGTLAGPFALLCGGAASPRPGAVRPLSLLFAHVEGLKHHLPGLGLMFPWYLASNPFRASCCHVCAPLGRLGGVLTPSLGEVSTPWGRPWTEHPH